MFQYSCPIRQKKVKNTLICFSGITWVLVYRTEKYKRLKAEVEKQSKKRKWFSYTSICLYQISVWHWPFFLSPLSSLSVPCLRLVEKKKETITESAGRQQKKKIGKNVINTLPKLVPVFLMVNFLFSSYNLENGMIFFSLNSPMNVIKLHLWMYHRKTRRETEEQQPRLVYGKRSLHFNEDIYLGGEKEV